VNTKKSISLEDLAKAFVVFICVFSFEVWPSDLSRRFLCGIIYQSCVQLRDGDGSGVKLSICFEKLNLINEKRDEPTQPGVDDSRVSNGRERDENSNNKLKVLFSARRVFWSNEKPCWAWHPKKNELKRRREKTFFASDDDFFPSAFRSDVNEAFILLSWCACSCQRGWTEQMVSYRNEELR
jgi:hypothetical protein